MSGSILPLRLEGLGFSAHGKTLIDQIDLEVAAGDNLIILGPNGAGKSLLLRLCHGLLIPDRGRVLWAGNPTRAAAQAMVFQRPVMLRRSVRGNLEHAMSLLDLPRALRKARVDEALSRFGLEPHAAQGARLLSGGEQQRLALARAWLMRPEILFLDEPTAAVDPGATRQIEAIIQSFNAEGMTTVMTTHNLGQAKRLAKRVAFLDRGKIVELAQAAEFFNAPKTMQAKAFLAGELFW